MILSFAKVLKKRNINYQEDLLVYATDISNTCAYMTYIQLALYGIPAVVNCGDTLSLKMRFTMETPFYFMQYKKFKNFRTHSEEYKSQDNKQKIVIKEPVNYKETIIKNNCQISLW